VLSGLSVQLGILAPQPAKPASVAAAQHQRLGSGCRADVLFELAALRDDGSPIAIAPTQVLSDDIVNRFGKWTNWAAYWLLYLPVELPAYYPAGLVALYVILKELWNRATSLGGIESLIEHRWSIEGEGSPCPCDLLRLSVGLEDADELYYDLTRALSVAC
jgi:Cys/Met metabolism PLP-dependent enzyme